MATGQTLLDTMEVLLPELQLQSGESGVTGALIALNRTQDMFESHCSQYGDIFGGSVGNLTITNGVISTAWPSGLLRLDGLDMTDGTDPIYPLDPIQRRGGHIYRNYWPYNLTSSVTTGRVTGYWTNGTLIYWSPKPGQSDTVRVYGFSSAVDITASGTFLYPDSAVLAFASVAARIIKIGLDDTATQLGSLATENFNSVLDQMGSFKRDKPAQYQYQYRHEV